MTTQTYLWNRRKKSKRIYIAGTDGKTLCQIENSRTRLTGRGPQIPVGRKLCANCKFLWAVGVRVARRGHKSVVDHAFARKFNAKSISSLPAIRSMSTPTSATSSSFLNEPRLSVLLGKKFELENPLWDESPGDDGWRGPRP